MPNAGPRLCQLTLSWERHAPSHTAPCDLSTPSRVRGWRGVYQELDTPHVGRREKKAPTPCSRCAQELLLHWNGPTMTGVWLELCQACDADRPAASALIHWIRDPGRRRKRPKARPADPCAPTAGSSFTDARW
ncbi:DUF6300 family protein [Streptomyces mirabilis]|uniref:DUF6300 family protein n=1 Tax=Streptomyces mirabilis TaxID=68239 RepID=UPI00379D6067